MKKWLGKKQVLMASLVVALGVAVYLNYYFASSVPLTIPTDQASSDPSSEGKHLGDSMYVDAPTDGAPAASKENYFEVARQNRQNARTEALEILQDTLQDVRITEDLQKEAIARVEGITLAVEQESAIENLILAKGYKDCMAYIDGENCHIVVQAEALDAGQSVQILDIVTTQSSVPAKNVNIVPVNS